MSLSISVDTRSTDKLFAGISKEIAKAVKEEIKLYSLHWQRLVSLRRIGQGGRGRHGGPRLHNRSGDLRRSVRTRWHGAARLMLVGGRDAPYAVMHELGGTIKPKRGKYLTVPLPAALNAKGSLAGRYKIRKASGTTRSGKKKYETDAGPTFIIRSKAGNLLIGVRRKNRKAVELERDLLYVLKRRVTIPPRLKAWELAQMDSPVGRKFQRRLPRAIVKAEREATR